jgi:hypothetical protein
MRMKVWRVLVILGVIGTVVAVMLVPALKRAKIGGGPSCKFYLKSIQIAKEMYAEDNQLTNVIVFTREQLLPYVGLGSKWPKCPKGGEYSIGSLHESPGCSFHTNLLVRMK